jgi:uncharacterized protein YndB with AHSA1/START domain
MTAPEDDRAAPSPAPSPAGVAETAAPTTAASATAPSDATRSAAAGPGREPAGRLELEVEIDAPREAVWEAISEGEGLARWFPLEAAVEPGVGGSILLSWGPGMAGEAPLTGWEPGRRLEWTETHPPKQDGAEATRIAVEFLLEGRGGATVLRLVQSGFGPGDEWQDYFDGVRNGWAYFLWNLKVYLERHRGIPRRLVWVRRRGGAPRDEVWRRLLGPRGLGIAGADGRLPAAGEPFALDLGDGTAATQRGVVRFAEAPLAFAGRVETLADAPLFIELEGGAPDRWYCGIWLSTYGLPEPRVAALQTALERLADRVLAR